MTRLGLLVAGLLAGTPAPVTNTDAFFLADDSLEITWVLPADASVTGLRIWREEWDSGDLVVFNLLAPTTSFNDATLEDDETYTYEIRTIDIHGHVSTPVFVDVFGEDDHHHDGHGYVECHSRAAPPSSLSAGLLAGLGAALLLLLRRA